MEAEKFLRRLQKELSYFNAESAEQLCVEIHKAEDAGYNVSHVEDILWLQLTIKLAVSRQVKIA